jgi:hypothetical protein
MLRRIRLTPIMLTRMTKNSTKKSSNRIMKRRSSKRMLNNSNNKIKIMKIMRSNSTKHKMAIIKKQ